MSPAYTPGKLILAQNYIGIDDPDAATYIAAVELADQQSLETATKVAIHSFVKGCKADGIWPAIKASCILAGARTLAGALVPLVGAAPTNFNFVSGDYDRKTGLMGDGITKELGANISSGSTGLIALNHHLAVYASTVASSSGFPAYIGANVLTGPIIYRGGSSLYVTSMDVSNTITALSASTAGFIGLARSSSASFNARAGSATVSTNVAFTSQSSADIFVFSRGGASSQLRSTARIAFYSIGESLNLALVDARVTALITAFGVAIP